MALAELMNVEPRCGCLFIPLLDCSGNMMGEKAARLNAAMEELMDELKGIDDAEIDLAIRVAPMLFSRGAEWAVSEKPVAVSDFFWCPPYVHGSADVGAALKTLSEKLAPESEGGWMPRGGEFPVLVLFSSVPSTDEYRFELDRLRENRWYRHALKLAVAIGADADREMLTAFAGSAEAVLDLDTFRENFGGILRAYAAAYFRAPHGPFDD